MTPLTQKQARERLERERRALDAARVKLRILRESMAGIPGILHTGDYMHDIEIMQAVIIRLMVRIERLELQVGIYSDEPNWNDFRVMVN